MTEDTVRITALWDFTGHDVRIDGKRIRYIKNSLSSLLDKNEIHTLTNLRYCFRPFTPDDMPIIGAMKFYPNIILNVG